MAEFVCKECGATNPSNARFCVGCDAYLGWDSAPPTPSASAAPQGQSASPASATATTTEDTRAQPPQVDLATKEAVLEPDTGASVAMRVRNNSTIVDAYRIDAVNPPKWLTIEQPEIRLMPGENQSMAATFKIATGAFVEAQTVKVQVRVVSLRDTDKFADAEVMLTVPRYGPPVPIRTRPAVVRLVDETEGRFEVILDNSASNYARQVQLAGSDTEAVVKFQFSSPTIEVPAGRTATVGVGFAVPPLQGGETRPRQLTVTATEEENTTEATVTVNQERKQAAPLRLRLEPSVLRVRDCPVADLSLMIDNREGKQDQKLRLLGRDPEGAVRFSFATPEIVARAGQITKTRLSVAGAAPPPGGEVSRPFSVIALDGVNETEASGTFVEITSDPPIKRATLHLMPEMLRRRGGSGRYQFALENNDNSQWLTAQMYGSDPERVVRFTFSPARLDIPPGGSAWGWVGVSAPSPERGSELTRQLQIEASDGRDEVAASATFIQRSNDWIPIVRALLTLIGAVLVILGALTPWITNLPDYYVNDLTKLVQSTPGPNLPSPGIPITPPQSGTSAPTPSGQPHTGQAQNTDIVEKTQPATRVGLIVLAIMMAAGLFAKGGKLTMSSALLIVGGIVGYFVFLATNNAVKEAVSQVGGMGPPMYGAYLVAVGAIVGFVGGVLARFQT
jgi:hypothetical protein